MAKKKRPQKNDNRGYSSTSVQQERQQETKLSNKQQQEHLQSMLMDTTTTSTTTSTFTKIKIDTTTKEFYKRMDTVYQTLLDLKFDEPTMDQIFIGLATSSEEPFVLTVEAALDWACLQLPTLKLPPILTEGHLRDADRTKNNSVIQVLQFEKNKEPTVRRFEETVPTVEAINIRSPPKVTINTWILNQYQYESDEEEEECNDSETNTTSQDNDKVISLLPEQVTLAQLEQQFQAMQADLADETANYMRSKHETKELKKSLQKLQGERNKWKQKVDKLLASPTVVVPTIVKAGKQTVQEILHEDDDDVMFDIFQETESGPTIIPTPTTQLQEEEETEESTDLFQLSSYEPSITKDWTGKTPKMLLEDHCKKNKIPRPTFAKMVDKRSKKHGCRVTIKCAPVGLTLEQCGPFYDWNDAQQYISTHALYCLVPELPLYRLLPPVFSDLWKSWLQQAQDAIHAQKDELTRARDDRIKHLISLVSSNASETVTKKQATTDTKEDDSHVTELPEMQWDESIDPTRESGPRHEPITTSLWRKLQKEFRTNQSNPDRVVMQQIRASLPMHAYKDQLLQTIAENSVTVLHAETGAGKTTQCPQFLLEQALSGNTEISILCTQPRRISALSVAERVAEEMCDRLGDLVGYQIRMERKRTAKTHLLFCTTGVVLRRLQEDPNLTGITHVVVDEVHERQWQIDFLLIALRKILQTTRQDLKIILMSATLDAALFCSFFGSAPLVSVPGRTFPVANYFLEDLFDATGHMIEEDSRHALRETRVNDKTQSLSVTTRGGEKRKEVVSLESQTDVTVVSGHYSGYSMATQRSMDRVDEFVINYDLIEDALTLLLDKNAKNTTLLPPEGEGNETTSNGAVLVFLPGMGEIRALTDRLKGSRFFGNIDHFDIIPMHSSLSPKDQKRAFLKPRAGCRKIILATNIAETSVTIPDCVCVIDSGLGREVRQDKRFSTSRLVLDWCSKASAKQRAGRAGRVQAGICLKLYSSRTHKLVMKTQAMPELQRVPLEEVCLSILAGKLANNCMDFLRQAPQPPSEEAVKLALSLLREVGAIDEGDALTPLGHHLSKIPVHVKLAKMLIFGSLFACLDKVLTIVGSLSCKSPFTVAINNATEAHARHKLFQHKSSDFLTSCNVWEAFRQACESSNDRGRGFCRKHFLNWTTLVEIGDMRRQNLDLMSQIGFVRCAKNQKVTEDWLVGSAFNRNDKNEKLVHAVICAGLYPNVARVIQAHGDDPPSLRHSTEPLHFHSSSVNHKRKTLEEEWVVYHEKFDSGRTTVAVTAPIHPFALLLFAGGVQVKHLDRKVLVDDWISLEIAAQTGVMFRELRRKLNLVLSERIESPDAQPNQQILDGIVRLLSD